MKKSTKATDISKSVREEVYKRDNHKCIICGNPTVQVAHYIPRSRMGLGIAENLVCLCVRCHFEYDNGKEPKSYRNAIQDYLREYYPNWNEKKLVYNKFERK